MIFPRRRKVVPDPVAEVRTRVDGSSFVRLLPSDPVAHLLASHFQTAIATGMTANEIATKYHHVMPDRWLTEDELPEWLAAHPADPAPLISPELWDAWIVTMYEDEYVRALTELVWPMVRVEE